MARYGTEHKEATRRRIVEAAGRRPKRDGIDGSGIAALMAEAGLTNGAFDAHFGSKDDLVASVVEEELRLQAATLRSSNGMNREWLASGSQAWGVIASQPLLYRTEQQEAIAPQAPARRRQTPRGILFELLSAFAPGRAGVEQLLRAYLSPEHRDYPDAGCPSAALLDEIGRSADATKDAYTTGAKTFVEEIATRLAPGEPGSAHGKALILFTMMIGTLQLSRAVADPDLSDEALAHGLEYALTFLSAEQDD